MNSYMRLIVFFDLPVISKRHRKAATNFRKFLIRDGYHMVQFSVYSRVCNGSDAVTKHKNRLYRVLPNNGSVRVLTVTERQYEAMEILVGDLTEDDMPFAYEQLTLF